MHSLSDRILATVLCIFTSSVSFIFGYFGGDRLKQKKPVSAPTIVAERESRFHAKLVEVREGAWGRLNTEDATKQLEEILTAGATVRHLSQSSVGSSDALITVIYEEPK